jgi:GNAT superfamily N-acetyltransferase
MPVSGVSILPVTPDRFDDVVELFGTRGDPAWCWCQYFVTSGSSYERSARNNKRQLRDQVQSATRPIGLIAYAAEPASRRADGPSGAGSTVPVGWVRVGPRPSFVRVTGNRALRALAQTEHDDLADESVWAVTCFVVKVGWRRRGIAADLLGAAVELARESGASAVVGHPVDVAARSTRVGGSELYHGAASTFAAAGFQVVGRTGATRPVMRLDLTH